MASLFWDVKYEISHEEINPVVVVSCLQLYGLCTLHLATAITLPFLSGAPMILHTPSAWRMSQSGDSITLLPVFASRDNDLLYQLFTSHNHPLPRSIHVNTIYEDSGLGGCNVCHSMNGSLFHTSRFYEPHAQ